MQIKQNLFLQNQLLFEEMRMEVRNERSQAEGATDDLKCIRPIIQLKKRTTAFDEMEQSDKTSIRLKHLWKCRLKHWDILMHLLRTEDGEVKVTVLSTEGHSSEMADEITHYVKIELGRCTKC